MTSHLLRIGGITVLLVACTIYPFLPGDHDSLAMPLSTLVQTLGAVGVLVVPVGVLWLASELRGEARRRRHLPARTGGYAFALASVMGSSVAATVTSLAAFAIAGVAFGVLALGLWLFAMSRVIPGLKRLKDTEGDTFNPVPMYLVFIPIAVLLVQLSIAPRATGLSREHAIGNAGRLIDDIERYRARRGRYPASLAAVHEDYHPDVIAIDRFHYALNGDGYDLFFEQPRFLLDRIGTREFVVYNRRDEQVMISHAAWILQLAPDVLEGNQGWYQVGDAGRPHWRCFWFD